MRLVVKNYAYCPNSVSRSLQGSARLLRCLACLASSFTLLLPVLSGAQVTLNWSDNSANELGFKIERALGTAAFVQIGTVGANVTSYADAAVTAGGAYSYRVRAYNVAGDSSYSNTAVVSVPLGAGSPPAVASVSNQSTSSGGQIGPITVAIADNDTATSGLTVTATSSNQAIVPNANVVITGSGATRNVTVTAAPGQSGVVTITLTVSDGASTRTETFLAAFGAALPARSHLLNLSARVLCRPNVEALIPGFVISGTANKRVLLRAVGPTLGVSPFNIQGVLPNPRMSLKRWDGTVFVNHAGNDNWGTNTNAAEIRQVSDQLSAFGLTEGGLDAVLLADLSPGQYTILVEGANTTNGLVIVELYDADSSTGGSVLRNLSNRGYVGTGSDVMITGFVVSSEGPKTVLIRAAGPAIAAAPYNVPNTISDPMFDVYRRNQDGTDTLIMSCDNWSDGPDAAQTALITAQVQAFAFPVGSLDAAMVATLQPGIYTVMVRGVNNATGSAIVELYDVE